MFSPFLRYHRGMDEKRDRRPFGQLHRLCEQRNRRHLFNLSLSEGLASLFVILPMAAHTLAKLFMVLIVRPLQ